MEDRPLRACGTPATVAPPVRLIRLLRANRPDPATLPTLATDRVHPPDNPLSYTPPICFKLVHERSDPTRRRAAACPIDIFRAGPPASLLRTGRVAGASA